MRRGARTTGMGAHPGAKMSWPAPSGLMVRSGNRHRPGRTGIRLPESSHEVREQNRGKYSKLSTLIYYRPFPEAHGHAIACVFITDASSHSATRGSLVMEHDKCAAAMAE